MLTRFFIMPLILLSLLGLNACDSQPPELMKASKQFESDEIRDKHIAYMRTNHMDALKHKRDETMYNGIRTKKYSLNACIDCHVPENYNGEVLRHTDQEHFCTTCHTYVAAKLDCFECHVDHPIKVDEDIKSAGSSIKHRKTVLHEMTNYSTESIKLNSLDDKELMALAFKYSNSNELKKVSKSGGVSFLDVKDTQNTGLDSNNVIKLEQVKKDGGD